MSRRGRPQLVALLEDEELREELPKRIRRQKPPVTRTWDRGRGLLREDAYWETPEGSLDYSDDHLRVILDRACAAADVKGSDHVERIVATHLSELITIHSKTKGDPLHLDVNFNPPSPTQAELIADQLAESDQPRAPRRQSHSRPLYVSAQDVPIGIAWQYPCGIPIGILWAVVRKESNEEGMPLVEPIARPPVLSVPEGTLWIGTRGKHPGCIVRIVRTNDRAVFFKIEKLGRGQGSNSKWHGQLRLPRDHFLSAYQPYQSKDWDAAALAATQVLKEPVAVIPSSRQEEYSTSQMTSSAPPASETPRASLSGKRRMRGTDFKDEAEINDIIEMFRTGTASANEIASAYNSVPSAIYSLLSQRIPLEYRLSRVVEYLRKQPRGPVREYQITQFTSVNGEQLRELLATEAAQRVIRTWSQATDPKRPYVTSRMVELIEPAAVTLTTKPEVEKVEAPPMSQPPAPIETRPVSQPTLNGRPEAPKGGRRWRVVVRTTVEESISAGNLLDAYAEAGKRFPKGEVLGVMAED